MDNGSIPIRINWFYEYYFDNKVYKYYPDFLLDDVIYEIKGRETKKDLEKYKSVDKKLVVIRKNDMKDIFNYIKNKYKVTNFYELYDYGKKSYSELNYNLCECGNKKHKRSNKCSKCSDRIKGENRRIVRRPTYNELIEEIKKYGYSGVAKMYHVSNTSIKNWKLYYEKNNN